MYCETLTYPNWSCGAVNSWLKHPDLMEADPARDKWWYFYFFYFYSFISHLFVFLNKTKHKSHTKTEVNGCISKKHWSGELLHPKFLICLCINSCRYKSPNHWLKKLKHILVIECESMNQSFQISFLFTSALDSDRSRLQENQCNIEEASSKVSLVWESGVNISNLFLTVCTDIKLVNSIDRYSVWERDVERKHVV